MRNFSPLLIILFAAFCIEKAEARMPNEFKLYQNIPNPFDTTGTTIQFDLPTSCFVELSIYDSSLMEVIIVR